MTHDLKTDDYARIAKTMKRLRPEFRDFPDEAVALECIETGAFKVEKYLGAVQVGSQLIGSLLYPQNKRGFMEGFWQVGPSRRAAEIARYKVEQGRAVVELQRARLESLRLDFELEHLPEMMAAAEFIRELQMQLQVDIIEDAREGIEHTRILRTAATAKTLTIDNDQALRLQEEKDRLATKQKQEDKNIDFTDHERRERLKFELAEKEIEAKVAGLLRLANTEQLVKDSNLLAIAEWRKRLLAETDTFLQGLYQKRIDQLMAEVFGGPSGLAGKKTVGEDPTGGSTPPESGSNPPATPGTPQQPNPSKDPWHVN